MSKRFEIIHVTGKQSHKETLLLALFPGLKPGRYLVEVNSADKRSNQANNFYWQILTVYIQPALYEQGWREIKTKEDAHQFTAKLFLTVKMVNEESGETVERIRSTTELNKEEFGVYLEEIMQWAAEYLSIAIPPPNSQTLIDY